MTRETSIKSLKILKKYVRGSSFLIKLIKRTNFFKVIFKGYDKYILQHLLKSTLFRDGLLKIHS